MEPSLIEALDKAANDIRDKVIAWRRDLHEHPELGNREHRTALVAAEHLTRLGMDVRTGLAHTGVVGLLQGKHPGPVVALRADMDALPVTEEPGLPFASKARDQFDGREVGVMHACGHDAHTAMLMGAAEVLAGLRDRIAGAVKFIFQPAEEGPPPGEQGGAPLMIADGALEDPAPEAIFGLHVMPEPAGVIACRPKGVMASQDDLMIKVRGRQTHGAVAWKGVDPIVTASQIIMGLQTICSRQLNVTIPAVITIGTFHAGVLNTIIPDEAVLTGTIRSMDPDLRHDIFTRIRRTAESIAHGAGATVEVDINNNLPLTYNDPDLYNRMIPTLQRVAGPGRYVEAPPVTGSEDFAYFAEKVPGLYFFLGINPEGIPVEQAAPLHSPRFFINEDVLVTGVRALAHLALDYPGVA